MNQLYKKISVLTGYTDTDVFNALNESGYKFSKNWVRGWSVGEGNKNYRRMTEQELNAVLHALIDKFLH